MIEVLLPTLWAKWKSFPIWKSERRWWKKYRRKCSQLRASDAALISPFKCVHTGSAIKSNYNSYHKKKSSSIDVAREGKQQNWGNHRLGDRRQKFTWFSQHFWRSEGHHPSQHSGHHHRYWVHVLITTKLHIMSKKNSSDYWMIGTTQERGGHEYRALGRRHGW